MLNEYSCADCGKSQKASIGGAWVHEETDEKEEWLCGDCLVVSIQKYE